LGGAQDQGLERVHRGGARASCLRPSGQQDPQRFPFPVRAGLGKLVCGQRIARGPGRVGRV
jgi:hypothetical protein